ncbi:MAG TPA: hypothetical protein VK735_43870 [Pseudonocardia sp.]|uniref:hypothetical protein n=1 Tax=Pseudonocardia sp. TaxID=60912 RepID=UPI002CDCCC6A|nr:hypothetical protein [Pseudonocardia sp.]HTF54425.1 hypothetical protein [Pseudonocardia sp.]
MSTPTTEDWVNRVRNHVLGWQEMGWSTGAAVEHLRSVIGEPLGPKAADQIVARARREAASPFAFFDAVFCLNLDQRADRWHASRNRFAQLGIDWLVERFPAIPTPHNHYHGCALSFRAMVSEARRRKLDHFLILEDDAIWLDTTEQILAEALNELAGRPWDLLYLGGAPETEPQPLKGCNRLRTPGVVTCKHALAVNRRAYERILTDIPPGGPEFDDWLDEYIASDQYLARQITQGVYRALIVEPRLATQPHLVATNRWDGALRDRYTIH